MSRHLRAAAVLAVLFGCVAARAQADPDNVTAGMLRTPTSNSGAPLRAERKMSADSLGHIAHGTRLTVEVVDGAWLRVSTEVTQADGTKARKTGWIKSADTVQPFALTGAGREGAVTGGSVVAAPSRGFSEVQVGAAGRGFDEKTVQALAQSNAKIAASLPQVDRLEDAKPTPAEVTTFAKEGRLGFPGRTR
jgi:hypothetical protein